MTGRYKLGALRAFDRRTAGVTGPSGTGHFFNSFTPRGFFLFPGSHTHQVVYKGSIAMTDRGRYSRFFNGTINVYTEHVRRVGVFFTYMLTVGVIGAHSHTRRRFRIKRKVGSYKGSFFKARGRGDDVTVDDSRYFREDFHILGCFGALAYRRVNDGFVWLYEGRGFR